MPNDQRPIQHQKSRALVLVSPPAIASLAVPSLEVVMTALNCWAQEQAPIAQEMAS